MHPAATSGAERPESAPPRMRLAAAACTLLLAACGYPQVPRERTTAVVVYDSEAEVPCEFEVMRRIEARATVPFPPPSRADQDRERDRVLARAGERVGADAVVAVLGRSLGAGTIGIQADTMPNTMTMDFAGDAIRFVSGTCRRGR